MSWFRFGLPRDAWPPLRSTRAQRFAIGAIYGLVLLAATAEILRSLGRQHAVIFHVYVQVGDLALAGDDPYDLVLNTWPPFYLFVGAGLALLARLSPTFALLVWQVVGALAIWGCCRLSAQLFLPEGDAPTFWPRHPDRLAFGSAAIVVPFLMTGRLFQEHLQHTQINAQVLFLVLLAFHLFRRARPAAGGLALAVAASTKAVPILLLPYLVYKRAWRALWWTAGFLALLNVVLPALSLGPERALASWRTWRAVAARETADPTPHFMNQSFPAALK
ncbi:MAG: glycosyltransferase family 87 protein, partial [Gemmatimonadales bacterium]